MKKHISLVLVILLVISVGGNIWQYIDNNESVNFLNQNPEEKIEPKKVLLVRDVEMTLNYDWNAPQGNATLKLDFNIENISSEPQTIFTQNISVFDYNNCRFEVSSTIHSKINPLLFSENINPKTIKPFSLIFEVPRDELYCIAYSANIYSEGKQIFTDKIRNIKCEYDTFEDMLFVRKNSIFVDISKPQSQSQINRPQAREEIVPEIILAKPSSSAYDALTKKGTNPANEIEVDLNDFLGTPDDGTDWKYTELSETDCKALARQKIYYSINKGAWVKEKPSTDNSTVEAEKRREAMERELKGIE
jgi:hypothetical protein